MISVVTWVWGTKYTPRHVNILRAMVARNLRMDYRFICITDFTSGLHKDIEVVPLPTLGARDPDPMCLKRLWMFSEEAAGVLGQRFVNIDVDSVIVDDITPLLARNEDFIVWKAPFYHSVHHAANAPTYVYNPSLMMMNAGARHFVWERFSNAPERELDNAAAVGWKYRSDQDIITNMLAPHEASWGCGDGIYAYWTHLDLGAKPLPGNARIVSFYGKADPSQRPVQNKCRFVVQHWHDHQ